MNKVEDSTGGVEGDEGEARPFASAAEMAEALAAEPLARDFAASSFGGTMTATESVARAEEEARERLARAGETTAAERYAPAAQSIGALRLVMEPAALREMREMRERSPAQRIRRELEASSPAYRIAREMRALGSPREIRELHALGRHLGLTRSAPTNSLLPAPPAAPAVTAPQTPAKDARAEMRAAAREQAVKRGEALRALPPNKRAQKARGLLKNPRGPGRMASEYGMTVAELKALAPKRKHRKKPR